LAGGKGWKRKFNKTSATVVAVPSRGCWVTILLHDTDQKIKWRKGGCRRLDQRQDPFQILDDSCCEHILSYLLEVKNKEIVWGQRLTSLSSIMSTVGKLHGNLRSIERRWKEVLDQNLSKYLGLVDVNFDAVPGRRLRKTMRFLVRHQIKLGALNFSAPLHEYQQLVDFMQGCDMKNLCKMRAYYNIDNVRYSINTTQLGGHVYDLTTPDRIADHVGIQATSQKNIHDLIAGKCPRLKELAVKLVLPWNPSEYSAYISTSLFSISSIEKLKISLVLITDINALDNRIVDDDIDELIFTRLIKNMPGLRSLILATQQTRLLYRRTFHLESESLEHLDVCGTSKWCWISCRCPNLVRYDCLGEGFGNGTRPILTQLQRETLDARSNGDRCVLSVTEYHFPQLEVSDACQVMLRDYKVLFWRGG